jgi:hypothetical protein
LTVQDRVHGGGAGLDDGPELVPVGGLVQHETAEHHGAFEAVAPPHDWWDWYASVDR